MNTGPAAGKGAPPGFLGRNLDLIKHWVVFVVVLGFMAALDQWFFRWINTSLSEATAAVSAWFLRLLGLRGKADGTFLWSTICHFYIVGECTAYYPCAIYIAAVVAFPCPWMRKLLGLAIGLPAILLVNQVRLVSLCYIAYLFPQEFETIHVLVWQSLIIVITVVFWLIWATTLGSRGHEADPA